MSEIPDWTLVDGSNLNEASGGMPEGMRRSNVNDRGREHLGAMRRWYDDPEFLDLMRTAAAVALTISKVSDTVVRVTAANMTGYFNVGRRVRMTDGASAEVFAHVVSAVFAAGNTDVTLDSFSGTGVVVPAGVTTLELHSAKTLGKLAFQSSAFGLYLPAAATGVAIQAAIDAAYVAGGGIVLLANASYALTAGLVVKDDVVLWGAGPRASILVASIGATGDVLTMLNRSAAIGVGIDQSAQIAGTRDAVRVATNGVQVTLEKLYLYQPDRNGIYVGDSNNQQISIRDVYIDTPSQDGIVVKDDNDDTREVFISDITVLDTGAGGAVDSYGVRIAGRVDVERVFARLDRAGPAKQRAVYLVGKNASGLQRAHRCRVSGVHAEGTGALAVGVEIGGENCTVDGVVAKLTGATSRGIQIDATGGGQVADGNLVRGCVLTGCHIGIQLTADAYDNIIADCAVRAPILTHVSVAGFRNQIQGLLCTDAGTAESVSLTGSSSTNSVKGCHIRRAGAGTAIAIASGAANNLIQGNSIHNCALGVGIDAASSGTLVQGNAFLTVTDNVSAVAVVASFDNYPSPRARLIRRSITQENTTGGAERALHSIAQGIHLPGPPADGNRLWRIRAGFRMSSCGVVQNWKARIHCGTVGDTTDPVIWEESGNPQIPTAATWTFYAPADPDDWNVGAGQYVRTLDAGTAVSASSIGEGCAAGVVIRPSAGQHLITVSFAPNVADNLDCDEACVEIEYLGEGV